MPTAAATHQSPAWTMEDVRPGQQSVSKTRMLHACVSGSVRSAMPSRFELLSWHVQCRARQFVLFASEAGEAPTAAMPTSATGPKRTLTLEALLSENYLELFGFFCFQFKLTILFSEWPWACRLSASQAEAASAAARQQVHRGRSLPRPWGLKAKVSGGASGPCTVRVPCVGSAIGKPQKGGDRGEEDEAVAQWMQVPSLGLQSKHPMLLQNHGPKIIHEIESQLLVAPSITIILKYR